MGETSLAELKSNLSPSAQAPFNKSPVKTDKTTKLAKDFTRDFRRVSKAVKNTVGGLYRPDLVKPALARWTKYHRSLLVIKAKKVRINVHIQLAHVISRLFVTHACLIVSDNVDDTGGCVNTHIQ